MQMLIFWPLDKKNFCDMVNWVKYSYIQASFVDVRESKGEGGHDLGMTTSLIVNERMLKNASKRKEGVNALHKLKSAALAGTQ